MTRAIKLLLASVTAVAALQGQMEAGVLIVGADFSTWEADVQSKLSGTGLLAGPIDIFDAKNFTPDLPTLEGYSSVLVYSDYQFANSTLLGNNLVNYVNAGGGVVEMTFANTSPAYRIGGSWATGDYSPIEPAGQNQGTLLTLGKVYHHASPILTGVHTFSGGTSSYYGTGGLNTHAVRIADWSNGAPLIAELDTFPGRIVSLNFYPPSSDSRSDFWNASTDGAKLMANALNYVSPGFVSPSSATTPEPSSLALFGIGTGMMGLAAVRRRREKIAA